MLNKKNHREIDQAARRVSITAGVSISALPPSGHAHALAADASAVISSRRRITANNHTR
jgi:hypothetical protein